ncbi:hypothetical protein HOF65_02960 [bacterium]|nr:hypothetical protein [bacterium]MBT3852957.1 hypothetical protein [bacterium]MBT4633262.1 hypothetical protein [bacterium]MBT6779020.1 hypothetical protein [bacterium]
MYSISIQKNSLHGHSDKSVILWYPHHISVFQLLLHSSSKLSVSQFQILLFTESFTIIQLFKLVSILFNIKLRLSFDNQLV